MQSGDGGHQKGCALSRWHCPEDDVAQGVKASPAGSASHLAELQGVEEDVIPSKCRSAAGHLDAVCQGACIVCTSLEYLTDQ